MSKEASHQIDEVVHRISFASKTRSQLFLSLPHEVRAEVLLRLTKRILRRLASDLPNEELVATLEHLDPDETTDIVQLLPKKRQKVLLNSLTEELKGSVEFLSQFDPETAAGLMSIDYVQVSTTDTVRDVAKKCKAHEKRTGRLPSILVLENGAIKGYLPGHTLGLVAPAKKITPYIQRVSTITCTANHKDVLKVFKSHPHSKIVVIGEHENVLGVIYSDDVLRLLEKQQSASLYDFAGVHEEETVTDNALTKIRFRYKWLIINLGTAFLAAFTVGLFDEIIAAYVLLAVYMPIVAGMGGNAATQTLAVLVRGISLKQITLKTAWPTLKRELISGFVNGAINGILVAAVVLFFNREPMIALVLGLAMIVNLVVAAFFGTLVPLIMQRLGKDPATSATIFITTATDVLGFLAFLGLATILLS